MSDPTPTQSLSEPNIYVALTHQPLDIPTTINRIRSPEAGAIVLFAGTTRSTFDNSPVLSLSYTSYAPKALTTLLTIARAIRAKHELTAIAMVHRLGTVPIGEESILIALSAPHRSAAWRAGEEALEECKSRVEVWKREVFVGGGGEGEDGEGEDGGVWRANRDGVVPGGGGESRGS